MRDDIDWAGLAEMMGTIDGPSERGGLYVAREALCILLGPEPLRLAVTHYIEARPGYEVARSVLSLLLPAVARQECYRIYRESDDLDHRRSSVELLRVVADSTTLPWIEEFLSDPDGEIQAWGLGVLDYLVLRDLLDDHEDQAALLLDRVASHSSEALRLKAAGIRKRLG